MSEVKDDTEVVKEAAVEEPKEETKLDPLPEDDTLASLDNVRNMERPLDVTAVVKDDVVEEAPKEVEKPKVEAKPKISKEQATFDAVDAELEGVKNQIAAAEQEKAEAENLVKLIEAKIAELGVLQKAVEEKHRAAKIKLKFKGDGKAKKKVGTPDCTFCGKKVYPTERTLDSKEAVFHKKCLKCEVCKTKLTGKEPITDETLWKLLPNQYRYRVDADEKPHLLCSTHGEIKSDDVRKASTKEEAQEKLRLERATMKRKTLVEKKKATAQRMEMEMGESPTDFEEGKRLPVRTFVKKVPERMIVTISLDAAKQKILTFMFDLNKETIEAALHKKKFDPATMTYAIDAGNRADVFRTFVEKYSDKNLPVFNMALREGKSFGASHPDGEKYVPQLNIKKTGNLFVKTKRLAFTLSHDGVLTYGKSKLALTEDHSFALGPPENKGIVISAGGKTVLSIITLHQDDAQDWIDAMTEVVNAPPPHAMFTRVSIYLFSCSNGVLQRLEVVALVSTETQQIGTESANIRCSAWPPMSRDEIVALDPLKNLKEQMHVKHTIEEHGAEKAAKMQAEKEKAEKKEKALADKIASKDAKKKEKEKKKKGKKGKKKK